MAGGLASLDGVAVGGDRCGRNGAQAGARNLGTHGVAVAEGRTEGSMTVALAGAAVGGGVAEGSTNLGSALAVAARLGGSTRSSLTVPRLEKTTPANANPTRPTKAPAIAPRLRPRAGGTVASESADGAAAGVGAGGREPGGKSEPLEVAEAGAGNVAAPAAAGDAGRILGLASMICMCPDGGRAMSGLTSPAARAVLSAFSTTLRERLGANGKSASPSSTAFW